MLTILALFACGGPAPNATPPETEPAPAPVEAPAQASTVTSISAADLAALLEQPSERPRVVNFWATWCAPCIEEIPRLTEWGRSADSAQLVFVSVDLHILKEKKIVPFVDKHGMTDFPNYQVSDKDPAVALANTVAEFKSIVPFTLVVPARGGPERRVLQGAVQIADIEKALEGL